MKKLKNTSASSHNSFFITLKAFIVFIFYKKLYIWELITKTKNNHVNLEN